MRNYNVESKSVHGKICDLLRIIFYHYLSDNIKKSNRVSASLGHTEHVLITTWSFLSILGTNVDTISFYNHLNALMVLTNSLYRE